MIRLMAMLLDSRLSEQARILGAYVQSLGPGEHQLDPDDFARVLVGAPNAETVRRHLRQLLVHDYIERRRGGQGQSNYYAFVNDPTKNDGSKVDTDYHPTKNDGSSPEIVAVDPTKNTASSLDPTENDGSSGDNGYQPTKNDGSIDPSHVRDQGDQKTSPSSSSSADAREAAASRRSAAELRSIDRLRTALGEFHDSVDFDLCPEHAGSWAATVVTSYLGDGDRRPPADKLTASLPPPLRQSLVATALTRYAAERVPWDSRFFRSFLETVIDEQGHGNPSSSTSRRGRPAAAAVAGAAAAADELADAYKHLG